MCHCCPLAAQPRNSIPTASWSDSRLIAHACGGINGQRYTNSREALEENYKRGFRVFEVDFSLTSDGRVVAAHDWKLFCRSCGIEGVPSGDEFLNCLINSSLHTLTLEDIAAFMRLHDDCYIVTDKLFENTADIVARIVEVADGDSNLLDHFVVQVYTDDNYKEIDGIYHFNNYIYTLYMRGRADLNQNIAFMAENHIPVVTVERSVASQELVRLYTEAGISVYAHTVNSPDECAVLLRRGVRGVYTDFLLPSEISGDLGE